MLSGTAGRIEKAYKVVIEKDYDHGLEKVWNAITKDEHVSAWMEYKAKIDLKVGGQFFVDFAPEEPLVGIINVLEPQKKLYYAWGSGVVMWELEERAGKTHLTFSHSGLDKNMAIGLGSGWEAFIDYIEPHLNGEKFPANRHEELMGVYEKMV